MDEVSERKKKKKLRKESSPPSDNGNAFKAMVEENRKHLIANLTLGLKSYDQKTTKQATETPLPVVKKPKRSRAAHSLSAAQKVESDKDKSAVIKDFQIRTPKVPFAPPKVEKNFTKRGIKPTSKEFCSDSSSSSGDEREVKKSAKEKQEQLIANMAITLNNSNLKPNQLRNEVKQKKDDKKAKSCSLTSSNPSTSTFETSRDFLIKVMLEKFQNKTSKKP